MSTTIALIVAAGRGSRVGKPMPKQYLPLGGRPVLAHSIAALSRHPEIAATRVVIHPDDEALYRRCGQGFALLEPVHGGASRQDSVRLGLESLRMQAPDRVLIHDGARPLVDAGLIARTLAALDEGPAAIAALPLVDTLKREADGFAQAGPDRTRLWRAQTPQTFHFGPILQAHRAMREAALTDDAAIAEQAGIPVRLVPGSEGNLKITDADDLERAERMLAARLGDVRVGSGFDVHAFGTGAAGARPLMLCGVEVPHDGFLAGHSDADVALHALTDAVLGAIGEGDIGQHFPPGDERWRGAASEIFLRRAAQAVLDRGGQIAHVDLTIICERPKVGPHRERMRIRLAEILCLDIGRVSVKATTTERLGFTGRGEGIAAQATATVRLP